jgi:hypothetical protein
MMGIPLDETSLCLVADNQSVVLNQMTFALSFVKRQPYSLPSIYVMKLSLLGSLLLEDDVKQNIAWGVVMGSLYRLTRLLSRRRC